VLDTVNLERRGLPAAVVALDMLLNSVGKAMANALGYPSLRMAALPYSTKDWSGAATEGDQLTRAGLALPQVESILTKLE
jgi:hypothetical protein